MYPDFRFEIIALKQDVVQCVHVPRKGVLLKSQCHAQETRHPVNHHIRLTPNPSVLLHGLNL